MIRLNRRIAAALFTTVVLSAPAFATPKDCSAGPILETPAKGTVGGKPFIPNDVSIQITKDGFGINEDKFDAYELSIMTDGIFNAATVHFLVRDSARADGKTFRVYPSIPFPANPRRCRACPKCKAGTFSLRPRMSIPASRRPPRRSG